MGNCFPLDKMAFYEYRCPNPKHPKFEKRQPMSADKIANCPVCGQVAEFRISRSSFRFAEPLITLQTLPHGEGYKEVDRKPDSSYSDERNLDIPPDYPNLLEV